jgi:hypothetical protein
MPDIEYTIVKGRDQGQDQNFVSFAPLTPKGVGKCSAMLAYTATTGRFLADQLPAIVANLERQGYTIAEVGYIAPMTA